VSSTGELIAAAKLAAASLGAER